MLMRNARIGLDWIGLDGLRRLFHSTIGEKGLKLVAITKYQSTGVRVAIGCDPKTTDEQAKAKVVFWSQETTFCPPPPPRKAGGGALGPQMLLLDTSCDPNALPAAAAAAAANAATLSATACEEGGEDVVLQHGSIAISSTSLDWPHGILEVGKAEVRRRKQLFESNDGDRAGGAFYIVDLGCILKKFEQWYKCFPTVKPFYAVKCNPNPVIIRALSTKYNIGFDCASPAEIKLVLDCSVEPSRIIFANPCKSTSDIQYAIREGVLTWTFDSENELQKIRQIMDGWPVWSKLPVNEDSRDPAGATTINSMVGRMEGLRAARAPVAVELSGEEPDLGAGSCPPVNLVLRIRVPDLHSDCPLGEKFGASITHCGALLDEAQALNLDVVGVSFHCGSGCQDPEAYPSAVGLARQIFDIALDKGIHMKLLDIGGGFPGWDGSEDACNSTTTPTGPSDTRIWPVPLSLRDVANRVNPVVSAFFPAESGACVIAEPGRYFVEASHTLFARIFAKRSVRIREQQGSGDEPKWSKVTAYFVSEGVYGSFKDSILCGVDFDLVPLPLDVLTPSSDSCTASTPSSSSSSSINTSQATERSIFVGPSWSQGDIVAAPTATVPPLNVGDWVYVTRMGAYAASISSIASSVSYGDCRYIAP
jgi:ornithine decarboxylase